MMRAFVFKNRGLLLSLPAALLAKCGRPSAASIALGLPIAIAGELVRCWAVGYSGETTRGDVVEAPELVTAGPYAYVRNPLYVGNFITAAGFAIAFTGKNRFMVRVLLAGGSLAAMAAVYAAIVPHEEAFLRSQFGEAFDDYCDRVPPVVPLLIPIEGGTSVWKPEAVRTAESKTFVTFAAMLAALLMKARKE
ncbi:MAG TPA: isoprenylcysteine carboxylmethyltransferase family protein [Candidatus Cybelea sp.]|jgi:protein-S-isoprenylcysteine O-methyltransferase Ste14